MGLMSRPDTHSHSEYSKNMMKQVSKLKVASMKSIGDDSLLHYILFENHFFSKSLNGF